MNAATPQLGVLIMDDGREFGDDACARLPLVRPNAVRLAVNGAPDRPGVRTVEVVPPEKFTVRRAVEAAAAEGLFWIAVPRQLEDPLSAFVDAARGAAGVLDEDHPGFAVVFAEPGWQFRKVALVADLRDPVTTGVAAWAAVGVARQFGSHLDVLVLGADTLEKPRDWREAVAQFSIRGEGEQLVTDALERAETHGVELRWRPLGNPANKPNAILRAVVEGGYDVVVDDLPPITVGPRVGRRRRVQAVLNQAGSNATAYRLVRDAPCSVVVVLDAVRMGLIPPGVLRAGAVTLALGVVGVGAMSGSAAAQTAAMTAEETTVAADAVADAEAVAPTEENLAAMEQELAAAQATADQSAAELAALQAEQAAVSVELQSAQTQAAELQPQVVQARAEAEEASKEATTKQMMASGPLEKLPGGPSDEEAEAAKQQAEQAEAEAANLEATYQSLVEQQESLSGRLQQIDTEAAATQQTLSAAQESVATLTVQTDELQYTLNPVVIPVASGEITTWYGESGGNWSSGYHTGIDFAAPSGTDVYAAKNGVVIEAGYGGAYGNTIVIQHEDGTQTRYAHLSGMNVAVGDTVTAGQHIGDVGSTGNTTGPHLHFEVMDAQGNFLDPAAWLGL